MLQQLRKTISAILWTRLYEEWISVPSAEVPVAEAVLWNPGGTTGEHYLVEFNVVNNDVGAAAIAGVYIGRDVGGGGALGRPEWWMFDETIPYPGNSGWRGPYFMNGDDDIRGVAGVANDASIHFRVRRVDIDA